MKDPFISLIHIHISGFATGLDYEEWIFMIFLDISIYTYVYTHIHIYILYGTNHTYGSFGTIIACLLLQPSRTFVHPLQGLRQRISGTSTHGGHSGTIAALELKISLAEAAFLGAL